MRRAALALLALCAGGAVAAPVPVIRTGVGCQVAATGQAAAPDTRAGAISLLPQTRILLWERTRLPAMPGVTFGMRLMGDGTARRVTTTVTHPPMGADRVIVQSWDWLLSGPPSQFTGYTLEEPAELLTGTWRITVTEGDTVLAAQDFTVVPPAQAADIARACASDQAIS